MQCISFVDNLSLVDIFLFRLLGLRVHETSHQSFKTLLHVHFSFLLQASTFLLRMSYVIYA